MLQLVTDALGDFGRCVLAGLSEPKKTVAARFFYDRRGSELFEEITRLPEYYPTRTETALLKAHACDIARLAGQGGAIVEFGSGSSTKTPILLDAVRPVAYLPIDISADFLSSSARSLASAHPDIQVMPIAGDFTDSILLPDTVKGPFVGFFPGSTIGNFPPDAAVDLLRSFRATLGLDARLVIGIDTRKNPALLEAAYDDSAGVTAAFNLNLLHRMNRELDGDIDVDAFRHRITWNDEHGRIEMHLEATRATQFHVAGRMFSMRGGETIHTENSYKYRPEEARLLARAAGWEPLAMWTDPDAMFALHVWQAQAERSEP